MDSKKLNKKQSRLNFTLSLLLNTVGLVSTKVYEEIIADVREKMRELKILEGERLEDLVHRQIVEKVFKDNFNYLETQGRLLVADTVRRFGVHYSLVAWFMLKQYISKKANGVLNGVPVIIEPFDLRFRLYPEYYRLLEKDILVLPVDNKVEVKAGVKEVVEEKKIDGAQVENKHD